MFASVAPIEQRRKETLPEISFIIPVANEGDRIIDSFQAFDSNLQDVCQHSVEYIMGTDVNLPGTLNALQYLAASGRCKAYFLTRRLGKGGTLKNIARFAKGKSIVMMDADFPVSPSFVLKCVKPVLEDKADIVLCERVTRKIGTARLFLSIAFNLITSFIFGTGMRDHQAGFKVVKRSLFEQIVGKLRTDGFVFDTELIVWCKKKGARFSKFNVAWSEKRLPSHSNVIPIRAVLTMLADLIILRLLTLVRSGIRLNQVVIGKIYSLSDNGSADEIMPVISAGSKTILKILRKLYFVVALER